MWLDVKPYAANLVRYAGNQMLDIREILKENVRLLLRTKPGSRMKKAEAMEVADGSLGRIIYGTGNPTLDVLERISEHFGIEAWQLLSPDLGRAPEQTAKASNEHSLANAVRETAAAYGRPRLSAENQQALQQLVESTIRSAISLLPAQTEGDLPTLNTVQKRIATTHGKVSTPEQLALLNRQLANAANKPTRKPAAGQGRGKA